MRKAELAMAVVMGIFSLYLMWKSAELDIGWIPDEGPGGGAWPFWLATAMLLSLGLPVGSLVSRTLCGNDLGSAAPDASTRFGKV